MGVQVTTVPVETAVTDRITLTIPNDPSFRNVASLVLGGIGTRADLPYERLDDLQLAVLSALESSSGTSATIDVEAGDGGLRVAVGPLGKGSADDGGLNLVLSRLVDEVAHEEREGAVWVVLSLDRNAAPS